MDSTRVSSARQFARVAATKWELVQVELQGKYSLQRMRAFYAYSIQTRWYHILLWCFLTPIPSLMVNILLDVPPLAPPSAGRDANYVFWARFAVFDVIISYWSLLQIGFWTPALGMKSWHALTTAIAITITNTIFLYVVAGHIPMPAPFVLLITVPVATVPTVTILAMYFGRKLKNDTAVREDFNRGINSNSIQFYLMIIYPAFIYGFNSIPLKYQPPYMILIPLIKIIAKNVMSRLAGSNDDLKPVEIIFNIDCFNAIYVSLVMQRATTIATSVMIMLTDVVQGCISVFDVYQRFKPLKTIMNKLPVDHSLYGKNFLEVAIALDQESNLNEEQSSKRIPTYPLLDSKSTELREVSTDGLRVLSTKVFVAPREPVGQYSSCNLPQSHLSVENRAAFLLATRKLLFTTEFVLLVEYTEVIMPVFYSFIMAATYNLPNRVFYSSVSGIGVQKLWTMVTSVLMYAALELMSLIVMNHVLRRITGVSPTCQVGFVLDRQCVLVQSKLLSWMLYAVQNSLEHFGADFSFQFKWLHSH